MVQIDELTPEEQFYYENQDSCDILFGRPLDIALGVLAFVVHLYRTDGSWNPVSLMFSAALLRFGYWALIDPDGFVQKLE